MQGGSGGLCQPRICRAAANATGSRAGNDAGFGSARRRTRAMTCFDFLMIVIFLWAARPPSMLDAVAA